jgi:hypothetical protein
MKVQQRDIVELNYELPMENLNARVKTISLLPLLCLLRND